jgi:hypothetical protein
MTANKSKYNLKLIIASAIIVVALAAAFFFCWDTTKCIIRTILEAKLTNFLLWTITVLIFLLHYFKHKDKEVKSEAVFTKKFGSFIDNAFGGIAYGTIITTALTLLKGLYIQKFFTDKQYFTEFNDLDLMTVFGVMIFLLYFAVMKVIDIAKETYKTEHTEQVFNEQRQVVNPDNENDNNSDIGQ